MKLIEQIEYAKQFNDINSKFGSNFHEVYQYEEFKNFDIDKTKKILINNKTEVKYDVDKPPCIQDFCIFEKSNENIQNIFNGRFNSQGKHISLIDGTRLRSFIKTVSKFWEDMPFVHRQTSWYFLLGFEDSFQPKNIKQILELKKNELTPISTQVTKYLRLEENKKRIYEVDEISALYIAAKVIGIPEDKTNPNTGMKYKKTRFVYNAVASNQIMSGYDRINFTTINCETLFVNNYFYDLLMQTSYACSFDKLEYYRQWYMDPLSWRLSIILYGKKHYVDTAGRMGSSASSYYATRLSNLSDYIFNQVSGLRAEVNRLSKPFSITNQDDSLVLRAGVETHKDFQNVTNSLGLELNPLKSQIYKQSIIWCGMRFDFKKKSVKIREKRINKAQVLLQEMINHKFNTRRKYAKMMGYIYSCRIIIGAAGMFLSPMLYYTRRQSYLFENFYDDEEIAENKEFYDVLVLTTDAVIAELNTAFDIISKEVSFEKARRGIGMLLNVGSNIKAKKANNMIYVDACLEAWGVGIIYEDETYSIADKFPEDFVTWSINVKELFACMMGMLIWISISVNLGLYFPPKPRNRFRQCTPCHPGLGNPKNPRINFVRYTSQDLPLTNSCTSI